MLLASPCRLKVGLETLRDLLTPVALSAAALLFALLALRDEVHLLAEGLRDALGDDALIESADQLLDCLTVTTLNFHRSARSVGNEPLV